MHFSRGLPGLERYRWFEVTPVPENHFFLMLQSREEEAVGMFLLDPFPFFPGYRCQLSTSDREDLELDDHQSPLIYTTVSIWNEEMFTNLAAPIGINVARRKGKQVYLPEYSKQLRVSLAEVLATAAGPKIAEPL